MATPRTLRARNHNGATPSVRGLKRRLSPAEQTAVCEVRSGFQTFADVVLSVHHVLEDGKEQETAASTRERRATLPAPEPYEHAMRIVLPHWERQVQAQQFWPTTTDTDRLAHAFASLEKKHKIMARMNLACCKTCTKSEFANELLDDESVGYVYFLDGGLENVVMSAYQCEAHGEEDEGEILHLYYTACKNKVLGQPEERIKDVATKTVRALRHVGLSAKWDGSIDTAIEVTLVWRKRVPDDDDDDDDDEERGENDGE